MPKLPLHSVLMYLFVVVYSCSQWIYRILYVFFICFVLLFFPEKIRVIVVCKVCSTYDDIYLCDETCLQFMFLQYLPKADEIYLLHKLIDWYFYILSGGQLYLICVPHRSSCEAVVIWIQVYLVFPALPENSKIASLPCSYGQQG
jgi:hypothetical protein